MEPSVDLAVQVLSLRKVYGNVAALDDVTFEVERGSVFCIIGPNGAGKTTTIECLEGLRQPDGGSVLVAGLDPTADRAKLESELAARVVLPRAALGTAGEDALAALPGVAYVRRTETSFYVYGGGNVVGNVADFLSESGVSPGVIETRPANLDDLYFLAVGNEGPRGGQE